MHANTANTIGIARNTNVVPLLVVMLPPDLPARASKRAREKDRPLLWALHISSPPQPRSENSFAREQKQDGRHISVSHDHDDGRKRSGFSISMQVSNGTIASPTDQIVCINCICNIYV